MAERVVTGMMLIVAIIHLIPLTGVMGTSHLASLYATQISGEDLEILMRHRAVLFGLLGGLFAYAAFKPVLQPISFLIAFASIASFLYLAYSVGGFNAALQKVVVADVVALVALSIAVVTYFIKRRVH